MWKCKWPKQFSRKNKSQRTYTTWIWDLTIKLQSSRWYHPDLRIDLIWVMEQNRESISIWSVKFHKSPKVIWRTEELKKVWQMKVKVKVTQLYSTLCNPMDYTVHESLHARILEWVVFPFSRVSSQLRDQTQVSCIAGGFFTNWATKEAQ